MAGYIQTDQAIIRAALKSALARLHRPVTAVSLVSQLPPMYKTSTAKARALLEDLSRNQEIWRWSPGKTLYYCGFDPAVAAQVQILALLGDEAKTLAEIGRGIKGLPGYNRDKKVLLSHLKPLLTAGRIYRHPPSGNKKTERFSQQPPDPKPHLEQAEQEIVRTAESLNLPVAAVYKSLGQRLGIPPAGRNPSAPSIRDDEQQILDALPLLLPKSGDRAAVTIRTLRRALFLGKDDFDAALLELARQGKVILHEHDFPAGMSPTDREELVQGEDDAFYAAAVLRAES